MTPVSGQRDIDRGVVMGYRLTLKMIPSNSRPRERLARYGASVLSTAELVAILVGSGSKNETAIDLANRLLRTGEERLNGGSGTRREDIGDEGRGLRYLAVAGFDELKSIKGIGLAKAAQIKAALELGRRLAAYIPSNPVIRCPSDVAVLLMEEMRYLEREEFRVVMLNTKNHVIGIHTASVGDLNSSIVHPREIFKEPIRRTAASVILVHNHPSGDPSPSDEDIRVTNRLREAGKLLGIEVLDHLIVGDNAYFSFKERAV